MTDELPTTYYWLRDDILARRRDGGRTHVWSGGHGPWRDWDTNLAIEGTPLSEQEAERRLLARGETSPFPRRLPRVETTGRRYHDRKAELDRAGSDLAKLARDLHALAEEVAEHQPGEDDEIDLINAVELIREVGDQAQQIADDLTALPEDYGDEGE
jgi:hypothetical protein